MRPTQGVSQQSGVSPLKAGITTIFCYGIEFCLWAILYGVFTETIGLLSDVYLSELPGAGIVFRAIDEDLTVSHAIAALLAFVSCAIPVFIWGEVLRQRIYLDPQAWLSDSSHRVIAALAGAVFVAVFALEVVNLYTLIARQSLPTTLPIGNGGALMSFLAGNKALGIAVSILIAVINVVVGFFTARATHDLKQALKEAGL